MNLPKSVRVGSADYELKLVKGLGARDGVWGLIEYGTQIISLEPEISPSKMREIFAHEVLHGMFHEAGLRNVEDEEEIVTALGPVLAMLLRDNDLEFMKDNPANTEEKVN